MASPVPPAAGGENSRLLGESRFDVRGVLGRGASGVVYHAVDRETGDEVALKTLVAPDAERIYHLKAEFRALAQITHPNLVQLDELVVGPESCFFTMELLHGSTFGDYTRAIAGHGPRVWTEPAVTRLRRVALQLASAITTLHDAGKLHRDIKPTNILVTPDDRAVLVDFGLCTELALASRMRSPFVGTLLYMAPEQAWGKPLTRAADWYAFGAVLYEAIVGRLPFEAEGSRLLFEKEKRPPVVDREPGVMPLLRLAALLMDPVPDRRPRSAEILVALTGTDEAVPSSVHPSVPFVGRAAETAALDAALDDVIAGRPAVVHVEGASGVGKSELVGRYLTAVERRPGTVVLRGRCHSRESVSYNGFDGVVDDLSEWMSRLADSELADIIPEDAGALLAIFPILARIEALTPDPDVRRADAFALRRRAFLALRELLSKIAERYTVVVALDDAQSGGADTAALLGDVFRPPNTPRVLLVLAYRSEEESPSTLFEVLRARAPMLLDSVHRVLVGPLPLAESRELAAELLRRDDAIALSHLHDAVTGRSAADRVAEESGGHPLFLRELALTVAASPHVEAHDLGRLITDRVDRLTDAERALLELASLASRPVSRQVLLAASGVGERARPDVVRLGRKRLVRETTVAGEPAVEPYHAKVREAVLGAWPPSQRQGRHRALADALLAEKVVDADAVVDHLRGASDYRSAARYAVIAAEKADAALAFDRAVHLYRVALDAAGDDPASTSAWTIRAALAAALVAAGRSREAADAYASASREAARDGAPAARDLERRAAEHYLRGGHIDQGTSMLRRVLDAAGLRYPSSGGAAVLSTIALRGRLWLRGDAFVSRSEEQVSPDELARIDACWSAGLGSAWIDTMRAAAFQARYMVLVLDAGEPTRIALGLSTEASQLAALGGVARTERARGLMSRALAPAERAGGLAHAFALLMAGTIEFYASRWREALATCSRAEALLRAHRSRSEWDLMTAHTLSLASMAYLGDMQQLRERQIQLLDEARDRGNLLASVCLACGPANIGWLAADEPDEAERRANAAVAVWKDEIQLPRYLHLVAVVQIALYRDDPAKALELLTKAWPRLVASMTLYVQNFRVTLRHLRGRCALALLARGGSAMPRAKRWRLLRLARSESKKLAAEDVAWAPALGTLLDAGLSAITGDTEKASASFSRASSQLRALDMPLYAAAADHACGSLVVGDAGRDLHRSAERWMLDARIVRPERLAAMLVPGVIRSY